MIGLLWWTALGVLGAWWEISLAFRGKLGTEALDMVRFVFRERPVQVFALVGFFAVLTGPIPMVWMVWKNRRHLEWLFQ